MDFYVNLSTIFELSTPENPMLHVLWCVLSKFRIAAYDIVMTLRRQHGILGQFKHHIWTQHPWKPLTAYFWCVVSNFKTAAYGIIMTLRRQHGLLGQFKHHIWTRQPWKPHAACFLVCSLQLQNCCLWHHNDATSTAKRAGSNTAPYSNSAPLKTPRLWFWNDLGNKKNLIHWSPSVQLFMAWPI